MEPFLNSGGRFPPPNSESWGTFCPHSGNIAKKESDKSEFAGVIDENCRSYRKQKNHPLKWYRGKSEKNKSTSWLQP